jgi:acyl-CoA synthetase (AMP-forming)/AMP-acid ligase II
MPGLEVRFLGPDGGEQPPGEAGELLVRDYVVMRGYLDDPAGTTEAIDADGWLHTGDVGYLRPDGNLVITDRLKDMFTVGGFNVYPAEVESVMARHPAVGQVSVIGVPDGRLGDVGMAFVIPTEGHGTNEDDKEGILAWTCQELANYKVPPPEGLDPRSLHLASTLPPTRAG